jgi:hypothetical protein
MTIPNGRVLTRAKEPEENGTRACVWRRAIWLTTASFTILASSGVFAEEGPSASVRRALVGQGLDRPLSLGGRRLAASLIPSLQLSAAIARMDGRGGPWSVTAWASLSWPLGHPQTDPVERVLGRRRSAVAGQVAEIWARREALRRRYQEEASAAARLDLDEADAELQAMTGEVAP